MPSLNTSERLGSLFWATANLTFCVDLTNVFPSIYCFIFINTKLICDLISHFSETWNPSWLLAVNFSLVCFEYWLYVCCMHQGWDITAKVIAKCSGQVWLPRSDGSLRTNYHLASEWHKWKQLPTVFISLGFVSLYRTNVRSLFKEELSVGKFPECWMSCHPGD